MDSQKKSQQRITVSINDKALEILRQRQRELAQNGLKTSISAVAGEAISRGLMKSR